MSTGQVSAGYAIGAKTSRVRIPLYIDEPIRKKKMKRTFRQKLRDWLFNEEAAAEQDYVNIPRGIETDRIESDGLRFNVWKANGGFVIETRYYDRKTDRNDNKMYVIKDDEDLGNQIGKIVTMESLR